MLTENKNGQIYDMKMTDIEDWNLRKLKNDSRAYRLIFNFCLERLIDSLNAISGNLYTKEHESITYNRLIYELEEGIMEKNYGNLELIYECLPVSLVNNAIFSSIGYFNSWKRERIKLDITIPFPKGISCKDMPSFVIGSKKKPIEFSSKGLYLSKIGRFKISGSDEEKRNLFGIYNKVKVFYKNSDCTWYCKFDLRNRKY